MSNLKICHASDLHSRWPDTVKLPKADLYLLTGDMLPDFVVGSWGWPERETSRQYQEEWSSKRNFREGLGNPEAPVCIVSGNHDFYDIGRCLGGKYFEVNDDPSRFVEFCGLKIGGMKGVLPIRYTSWNDQHSERELEIMLEDVPDDLDILLTHTPPYNVLDDAWWGRPLGSQALADKIEKMSNLKMHCFGHIHESFGEEKIGSTIFSNAATTWIVYEVDWK